MKFYVFASEAKQSRLHIKRLPRRLRFLAMTDAFLEDGCVDTAFLKDNGITIVYTRGSCDNPALTLVREGVYLLK